MNAVTIPTGGRLPDRCADIDHPSSVQSVCASCWSVLRCSTGSVCIACNLDEVQFRTTSRLWKFGRQSPVCPTDIPSSQEKALSITMLTTSAGNLRWAAITILLAVATLFTALRAATVWFKASKGELRTINHPAGSKSHTIQLESEAADASLLNAQAALWSGATAVLSALTAIWSAMRPFF